MNTNTNEPYSTKKGFLISSCDLTVKPEKLWAREKEECAYLGMNLMSAVLPMKTKTKMADGETRTVIFQLQV